MEGGKGWALAKGRAKEDGVQGRILMNNHFLFGEVEIVIHPPQ